MDNANAARLNGSAHRARSEGVGSSPGISFTGRIANWSARHRWWVIGASLMVVVLAFFVLNAVETKTLDYIGEGESAVGSELIQDRFDVTPSPTEQLVFSPNPPKDTDGRREGSGRGWVRELQGRWPGVLG